MYLEWIAVLTALIITIKTVDNYIFIIITIILIKKNNNNILFEKKEQKKIFCLLSRSHFGRDWVWTWDLRVSYQST